MHTPYAMNRQGFRFRHESTSWLRLARFAAGICFVFQFIACSGIGQLQFDTEYTRFSLGPTDLETSGIGFLTPTAATGREADNQSLALNFAKQLEELRPEIKVIPLAKILSAVNAANLNAEYKQMYQDYVETAVLNGEVLKKIGVASGVRYFAKLSLASFRQETRGRFSLLGLRLFDTKQANLRVFMEIWDSHTGSVAWEGGQELNYAYDSSREKPVTFHDMTKIAAKHLYSHLPGANAHP